MVHARACRYRNMLRAVVGSGHAFAETMTIKRNSNPPVEMHHAREAQTLAGHLGELVDRLVKRPGPNPQWIIAGSKTLVGTVVATTGAGPAEALCG